MREPTIPEFDAETYLAWESRQDGRFELHHGFVVAFAGGTADHDRIALNLRIALERAFPAPCRSFGSDFKVRAAERIFYYPDASVTCDEIGGDATSLAAPVIVAEVLSPSTRTYDLIDKRAAYRQIESLDVFIVVHTDVRRVDLDSRDPARRWFTTAVDDGFLPIGDGSISLDAIYARTSMA